MMNPMVENNDYKVLTEEDFNTVWQTELSPWLRKRLSDLTLAYRDISGVQFDEAVIQILRELETDLGVAGQHRLSAWETGWGKNRAQYAMDGRQRSLVPGYFGKLPLVRWNKKFIEPVSNSMEYEMLGFLLDWVFDTYFDGCKAIYEFGCGTGHNLVRARERHPNASLWGLDWAEESQRLIQQYAEEHDTHLYARKFDYFAPDPSVHLEPSANVLTVASLEQIGKDFEPFISYLLSQPIDVVVHIEPIGEVLDQSNLLDYLSLRYFKKRSYLEGLVTYLQEQARSGKIEIIDLRRTYIGSFFIDGYTLVAWRPIGT